MGKWLARGLICGVALVLFPVSLATAQTPDTNLPDTVFPPYLQNPTADGMTIFFLAQAAENVRVTWNAAGTSPVATNVATPLMIPGTVWTMWKIRLTSLVPSTVYTYQVHFKLHFGGESFVAESHHFQTLNPAAGTVRFAVFNDIHQHDETLVELMHYVKPDDYEFAVLLGDCFQATPNEGNLFRAWRAYLKLLDGANKPMVFVRGNHDTRSSFADRLKYLFDLSNLSTEQSWGRQEWQFTLRDGPVWLLAMGTGEDENDINTNDHVAYKHPEFWRAYRQRQADQLKNLLATHPDDGAAQHIFLSHIPLYNGSPWDSPSSRQIWEPLLRDANLDLMLAAHDHSYKLLAKKNGGHPPWSVLIGGGSSPQKNSEEGTVMLVTASQTNLHVRVLAASDGRQVLEYDEHRAVKDEK